MWHNRKSNFAWEGALKLAVNQMPLQLSNFISPRYYNFLSFIQGCQNPGGWEIYPPNNLSMVYICIPPNNMTLVCIWAQVSTRSRKKGLYFWWRPFFWSSLNLLTWKKSWSRFTPPPMLKIGQNWGKIANYSPPNAQQRLAPLLWYLCCMSLCHSPYCALRNLKITTVLQAFLKVFEFNLKTFTSNISVVVFKFKLKFIVAFSKSKCFGCKIALRKWLSIPELRPVFAFN